MRLTVDASVVVKWFVSEELAASARLLRAHRLELHAPDLLLAEFVNVVWKKARRREIPDVTGYLDEIPHLQEDITLHSMSSLIGRAGRISLALDHPIYDCLYLACTEETGSSFVTADQRLVNKVEASGLGTSVRYLSAVGFADDIGAAALTPVITRETVEALLRAYEVMSATGTGLRPRSEDWLEPPSADDIGLYFDSTAYRRLITLLQTLTEEERIDLLALGWFGRPDGWDWKFCFEYACDEVDTSHDNDLIRNAQFWQKGYERLFDAEP